MTETRITIPEIATELTEPTTADLLVVRNMTTGEDNRVALANLTKGLGYTPAGTGAVATTVEDILDAQLMVDYVALRAYTGLAKTVRITGLLTTAQPQGIAGFFQYDETDVTSSDNGGTIIVDAGGRRWKRVFSDSVNVKWFGALGDGFTNDTTAIQNAINYLKASKNFNNGENSGPRGGPSLYFPKSVYAVNGTIVLTNINGLKFFGDGKEASMLVHTANSGSLFDVNQMLFTTFSNLGFAAGTVTTNSFGNLSVNVRTSGARTTNLFDWLTETGSDRFNTWSECLVKGGFARAWDVGGSSTHSENVIEKSQFFDCDYVWYSNNVQSVNTYFIACDAEFISIAVWYFLAGGNFTVTGGSYINPVDNLLLAGTNAGIGTSNGKFSFFGVRWEMFQNIDPTKSPRVFASTSNAAATVTFRDCNATAASDAAKTVMSTSGALRIKIECSEFIGVFSLTPNAGRLGYLSFTDCERLPTVTRNLNSGSRYKVTYNNSGTPDGPILNTADVDDTSNRVFSYQKNVVRLRFSGTVNAGTTALTFSVPTNVFFNSALLTFAKSGGVSVDVNVYLDAAKTILLFTQATGTTLTNRLWNPAITYAGSTVTNVTSNGTLYVDIVSAGSAGLSNLVISLEYASVG